MNSGGDNDFANTERFEDFHCVVLRGLPGSGKSTLAALLATRHGFVHLEADQHFVTNGTYRFDPSRVADAHAVVARDTLAALQAGRRVVVANTHVRLWEMAAVVGATRLAGRTMCFVECQDAWPNVHGLPDAVIASMRQRWELLPDEFDAVSFQFHAAEPLQEGFHPRPVVRQSTSVGVEPLLQARPSLTESPT